MRDLRIRDIRRCLFGSVNHVHILDELKQITVDLYQKSVNRWEFDFGTGLPKVANTTASKSTRARRYWWTRVSNTNSAFTPHIESIAEEPGPALEASENNIFKFSSGIAECADAQNRSNENNAITQSPDFCRPRTRSMTSSILAAGSPPFATTFQSTIRPTEHDSILKETGFPSTEFQVQTTHCAVLESGAQNSHENPLESNLKDSSTISINTKNINFAKKGHIDISSNAKTSKFVEDLQKKSNNSNNCNYDQGALLDSRPISDNILSRSKKVRGLRVCVQNSMPTVDSCTLPCGKDRNINNVVSNNLRNKSNRRHSIAELYIIPSYFTCVTPEKKSAIFPGSPIEMSPGGLRSGQSTPGTPGTPRSGRRLPVQDVFPEGLMEYTKGSPDTKLRDGKRLQKSVGQICERKRRASDYFPMKKKRHSLSGSPGGILQRIY